MAVYKRKYKYIKQRREVNKEIDDILEKVP